VSTYRDGERVNGHRFDAATQTWLPYKSVVPFRRYLIAAAVFSVLGIVAGVASGQRVDLLGTLILLPVYAGIFYACGMFGSARKAARQERRAVRQAREGHHDKNPARTGKYLLLLALVVVTAGIIGGLHWKSSKDAADAVAAEQARWDAWGSKAVTYVTDANGCQNLADDNATTNPAQVVRDLATEATSLRSVPFSPDGGVVSGKYMLLADYVEQNSEAWASRKDNSAIRIHIQEVVNDIVHEQGKHFVDPVTGQPTTPQAKSTFGACSS